MNPPEITLISPGVSGALRGFVEKLLAEHPLPQRPSLYTLDDIFEKLAADTMQLWFVFNQGEDPFFFFITERHEYKERVYINIFLAAGSSLFRVGQRMDTFEAWARAQGALWIECQTLPEIAHFLTRADYMPDQVVCYKHLITMH